MAVLAQVRRALDALMQWPAPLHAFIFPIVAARTSMPPGHLQCAGQHHLLCAVPCLFQHDSDGICERGGLCVFAGLRGPERWSLLGCVAALGPPFALHGTAQSNQYVGMVRRESVCCGYVRSRVHVQLLGRMHDRLVQ
jgi:hypothetical protein